MLIRSRPELETRERRRSLARRDEKVLASHQLSERDEKGDSHLEGQEECVTLEWALLFVRLSCEKPLWHDCRLVMEPLKKANTHNIRTQEITKTNKHTSVCMHLGASA